MADPSPWITVAVSSATAVVTAAVTWVVARSADRRKARNDLKLKFHELSYPERREVYGQVLELFTDISRWIETYEGLADRYAKALCAYAKETSDAHQEALRAVREESNASDEAKDQLIQRREELRDKLDLLAGEKVAQALNDGLYAIDMSATLAAEADEVKRMRTSTAAVMQGSIRIGGFTAPPRT